MKQSTNLKPIESNVMEFTSSRGYLFPFDAAKVVRFSNFYNTLRIERYNFYVILDINQEFVCAHNTF